MKNLHLIETDKPSKLWKFNNEFYYVIDGIYGIFNSNKEKYNLYITSNEEIKEGVNQWYLDKVLNEPYNSGGAQYSSKQDVIILTTDQDLIKDGIQPIDDEFLEWFVKNPSCEEVEVIKVCSTGRKCDGKGRNCDKAKLKIITHERSITITHVGKPKQETIEQAAKTYRKTIPNSTFGDELGFIDGAKWQKERSYSEEEVKNLFRKYQYDLAQWILRMEDDINSRPIPTEWFEQYKKK